MRKKWLTKGIVVLLAFNIVSDIVLYGGIIWMIETERWELVKFISFTLPYQAASLACSG